MRVSNFTVGRLAAPLSLRLCLLPLLAMFVPGMAAAHGSVSPHRVAAIEVRGELPPPKAGVASIKFGEFFRMPIGPLGLEPSEKLLALNGKPVRLVGYMVREETPGAGHFLFSPLPVSLGDEDESLSDDLPPTTVTVHLHGDGKQSIPWVDGLIQLSGTLEVGALDEGDGRVSAVRLVLDAQLSRRILRATPIVRAAYR
jgi:hypothetical protein